MNNPTVVGSQNGCICKTVFIIDKMGHLVDFIHSAYQDDLARSIHGDNNCYFSSLKYTVTGNESQHYIVHEKVVEQMLEYDFKPKRA